MTKVKQHVETVTCDVCGATTSRDCDKQSFGGHPFGGWYHLEKQRGSTMIKELQKQTNWDFCSTNCLCNWVRGFDCQP